MFKITIVLDNLRSCHNVGSIIRTANGFGRYDFIFLGTTPYPKIVNDQRLKYQIIKQSQQIHKTALGAETEIKGLHFNQVNDFLNHKQDYDLICLEQTARSQLLQNYRLKSNIYLILGNEVNGVSDVLLNQTPIHLQIPMQGNKESLNVAVALGITLYQLNF